MVVFGVCRWLQTTRLENAVCWLHVKQEYLSDCVWTTRTRTHTHTHATLKAGKCINVTSTERLLVYNLSSCWIIANELTISLDKDVMRVACTPITMTLRYTDFTNRFKSTSFSDSESIDLVVWLSVSGSKYLSSVRDKYWRNYWLKNYDKSHKNHHNNSKRTTLDVTAGHNKKKNRSKSLKRYKIWHSSWSSVTIITSISRPTRKTPSTMPSIRNNWLCSLINVEWR